MNPNQAPKITLGFYSPSPITLHLFQELLEGGPGIQFIPFLGRKDLKKALEAKNLDGCLWEEGVSTPYLLLHLRPYFKGQEEQIPKPLLASQLQEKFHILARKRFLKVGPYFFDEKQRSLLQEGGASIQLREKEADLLLFLLNSPHQQSDRKTILQHVWGYPEGSETHTLETHIYHLRQKIEKNPASPQFLLNDGTGYRLV